jgi:hypothetical protein
MKKVGRYFLNWAVVLDVALNTILGGDPHETLSSRAGKALTKKQRWACVLCRCLDLFQKDHCVKSILPYVGAEAVSPDATPTLPGNNGA